MEDKKEVAPTKLLGLSFKRLAPFLDNNFKIYLVNHQNEIRHYFKLGSERAYEHFFKVMKQDLEENKIEIVNDKNYLTKLIDIFKKK